MLKKNKQKNKRNKYILKPGENILNAQTFT